MLGACHASRAAGTLRHDHENEVLCMYQRHASIKLMVMHGRQAASRWHDLLSDNKVAAAQLLPQV